MDKIMATVHDNHDRSRSSLSSQSARNKVSQNYHLGFHLGLITWSNCLLQLQAQDYGFSFDFWISTPKNDESLNDELMIDDDDFNDDLLDIRDDSILNDEFMINVEEIEIPQLDSDVKDKVHLLKTCIQRIGLSFYLSNDKYHVLNQHNPKFPAGDVSHSMLFVNVMQALSIGFELVLMPNFHLEDELITFKGIKEGVSTTSLHNSEVEVGVEASYSLNLFSFSEWFSKVVENLELDSGPRSKTLSKDNFLKFANIFEILWHNLQMKHRIFLWLNYTIMMALEDAKKLRMTIESRTRWGQKKINQDVEAFLSLCQPWLENAFLDVPAQTDCLQAQPPLESCGPPLKRIDIDPELLILEQIPSPDVVHPHPSKTLSSS